MVSNYESVYDVCVVGAGPAGSITAYNLAKKFENGHPQDNKN